ncbi:MAG: hypothetical protein J5935_05705 [Lachnospiraceae bacterium]|nr:hypothetical protein [Lachnospiraceae bacterium]
MLFRHSKSDLFLWALLFVLFFFFATLALYGIERILRRKSEGRRILPAFLSLIDPPPLAVAAFLVLCWLPYLIIYAPGLMNYDTVNQILDALDGVAPVAFGFVEGQEEVNALLNAHHPVFVSLLFAAFVRLGMLLGHPSLGVLLCCIFQMCLLSACIAYTLRILKELDVPAAGRNLLTLFFGLFPFVGYYAITMLKNTIHSALYIPWLCLFFLACLRPQLFSNQRKAFFIVLSILLCLTQNTGIYLVLLSGLGLLLCAKESRKTTIAALISCSLLMFFLLPRILYPALNIYPGGKQEIYGTLFQQTAHYLRDYPEEITAEEKEAIAAVLDYDKITHVYATDTSDPVKATYNLHATKQERNAYLRTWAKMGLKHPGTYLQATFTICGPFFTIGSFLDIFRQIPSHDGVFAQIDHYFAPGVYEGFTETYYALEHIPGIDLFFEYVFYTVWLPSGAAYVIRKKIGNNTPLLLLPSVVNALFLIVSPMVYSRYALSLIFTTPILFVFARSLETRNHHP